MTKAELRTQYKARRAALPPEMVAALTQQITERFFADETILAALNIPDAVLHTYLPIRQQNEVNTWPIIRRVWAEWPHVRVLSSVTDPTAHTLISFTLSPDTYLTENRWGIPEPTQPTQRATDVPTLVIVPLLVFDGRGHRIGYGGGYYDRFLAELPPTCLMVGLSFFSPTNQYWAVEETDVPLALFVTAG
jgi:5-formyltetrahydrofolate cyclo-ligase